MNVRCLVFAILATAFPALLRADENQARVKQILERWQAAAEANCYSFTEGRRREFDKVFEVETRGRFRTASHYTGRVIYRMEPEKIDPAAVSERRGKNGEPYQLREQREEIFFLDDDVFAHTIPGVRTAVRVCRPADGDSSETAEKYRKIFATCRRDFGFLAGTTFRNFVSEHCFELISETERSIRLTAIPKADTRTQEGVGDAAPDRTPDRTKVELVLDARTYRLKSSKFIDESGTRETVYDYERRTINEPFDADDPLFDIAWSEYKVVSFSVPE